MEKSDESPRVRRLRELVDRYGGDHNAFARAFEGVSASYVYQVLNNYRNFGERAAKNMALKLGKPEDYFEEPRSLPDRQQTLLDAVRDFDSNQFGLLLKAAGWIEAGIKIKAEPIGHAENTKKEKGKDAR